MSVFTIRVVLKDTALHIPQDLRGKKLSVNWSYCRGCIVAAVYLDKWHGAESSQSRDWEALNKLREEVTKVLGLLKPLNR